MSGYKLSIIIPMYNVERYIERCIYSCINQSPFVLGKDYEIICINDGSPDKSSEIAKGIARNNIGLEVYDQDNQGLSAARNKGLSIANGDYVWFVDSDDWIEEGCLKSLCDTIINLQVDICHLSYRLAYDNPAKNHDISGCLFKGVKNGQEVTLLGGLDAPAQFCIFRKDFLNNNNLEFVVGIMHEDSEFKPRAVYYAQKIICYSTVVYNYYQREQGNIMSNFSMKRARDLIFVNNSLYFFSRNLSSDIVIAINNKISLNFNTLFYGYRELNFKEKNDTINLLRNNRHLIIAMIHTKRAKYIMEGLCFGLSIRFGFLIHKLMR